MTTDAPRELLSVGPGLAVILIALTATGAAGAWLGRTGYARALVGSAGRATVQLAVLGMALSLIIETLWSTAVFVGVMSVTAGWTAARRITGRRPGWREAALTAATVSLPSIALAVALVLSGVLPSAGIAVIPVAGSGIGAAMTAAGLAGRRALEELEVRRGEVEAGLALGLEPRFVRLDVCRAAAATALVPALDQTRTVGLVTIPGAFVGMVLGGASPIAAGAMQLYVLIAILAVAPIGVVAVTWGAAQGWYDATAH